MGGGRKDKNRNKNMNFIEDKNKNKKNKVKKLVEEHKTKLGGEGEKIQEKEE